MRFPWLCIAKVFATFAFRFTRSSFLLMSSPL